jgi:hypothetical protein
MEWEILFHGDFVPEFEAMPEQVQDALLAATQPLRAAGPSLGRPNCDTLKGSQHANMKELRFTAANGVWRAAFAFDPKRRAVVLVAGNKAGAGQRAFYKALIAKADGRMSSYLAWLKAQQKKEA